jgi:hypothetical protein
LDAQNAIHGASWTWKGNGPEPFGEGVVKGQVGLFEEWQISLLVRISSIPVDNVFELPSVSQGISGWHSVLII